MREDAELAARQLGEQLTGEAQARFDAARDLALDGESRRRDIDGPDTGRNEGASSPGNLAEYGISHMAAKASGKRRNQRNP